MRRLYRLFNCALFISAINIASSMASRSNSNRGENHHESYHHRLQEALTDSLHQKQALDNIIKQYEFKKNRACASNRADKCNLYTHKLLDANRIKQEIAQKKSHILQELLLEEEAPEGEEELEKIEREENELAKEQLNYEFEDSLKS